MLNLLIIFPVLKNVLGDNSVKNSSCLIRLFSLSVCKFPNVGVLICDDGCSGVFPPYFCECICSGSAVLARPAVSDICHFVFSHNFRLVTEVCAVDDEGFVSLSVIKTQ